jgi:hypothetical protein
MLAWNIGEDVDPESGELHLAHAGACLLLGLDLAMAGYIGNRANYGEFQEKDDKDIVTHTKNNIKKKTHLTNMEICDRIVGQGNCNHIGCNEENGAFGGHICPLKEGEYNCSDFDLVVLAAKKFLDDHIADISEETTIEAKGVEVNKLRDSLKSRIDLDEVCEYAKAKNIEVNNKSNKLPTRRPKPKITPPESLRRSSYNDDELDEWERSFYR